MLQFSTYGTCPMTFDAIKLGEQWVPCDFIPHRAPVISVPGPNGLRRSQQNSANTILHVPSLLETPNLWKGRHEVRCGGRVGVFTGTAMRTNGPLGYIEYTSGA
jgi:hypothetical protein